MLHALVDLYRQCWRYALACPLLFLVPVAAESAQHIAEYAQGFYVSIAGARASAHSLLRLEFGTFKVISLLVVGYWVIRWLEWRDPRRALGMDRRSLATFLPLLLLTVAMAIPSIWVPALFPALARPIAILSLATFPIGILLTEWSRTAALGESGGPIRSIKLTAPVLLWGFALNILAVLPPMAVHYALSYGAMKVKGTLQFLLLSADTLFVGYLGAIVSGLAWYISEQARARRINAR